MTAITGDGNVEEEKNEITETDLNNNYMDTLKSAFMHKYPQCGIILRMYEDATGEPPTWGGLSKLRLQKFVDYMNERVSPNTVRQYCAKFKAVLNLYNEEIDLPRDYAKILSPKQVRCSNIWLTDEELTKLRNYTPCNETERCIVNQFLIGAYSGARHSDFIRFDDTNIREDMLCYVSQKTKILATVPLKPLVAELLRITKKRTVSDSTFNSNIRHACMSAGITTKVKVFLAGKEQTGEKWKFVSSHTARRSFATNLYLLGADLYSISKMMGHSSVSMTEGYLCCQLKEQDEKVLAYFK